MTKHKVVIGVASLALSLFSWSCAVLGAGSNPWEFLPTRVLDIEGGSVSFQSAVIVDTRKPLTNPMLQDYPTNYILPTTNDSSFPIWVEAEWRVPDTKPFTSFGKLEPNNHGTFYVKTKNVIWNKAIPIGVTIYADQDKKRKLGGRDVVLLFRADGEERAMFLKTAEVINSLSEKLAIASGKKARMPVLPGFQEMVDISRPVPGTSADMKLTEDIRLLLWRSQSRAYWDCTHEVLDAKPFDPKESKKFKNLSDEDKQLIETGRSRGDIAFEEWRIKSCTSITTYLVLIGKSPKGGTDLMLVKVGESGSP